MSDSLGGYPTVWFCDSPQKEFVCGICLDVLRDPQQCKNGHLFCSPCISIALESHLECPTCKTYLSISRLSSNLLAKNLIDQMQVKCNLDEKHSSEEEAEFSCKWTGPLHERAAHLSECPVQMVRCPLFDLKKCQNCSGLVPRNGLAKHLFCLSPEENSEIVCSLVSELTALKGGQIGGVFSVLKIEGGTYVGEVKDGLRNGFGTAKYVCDEGLEELHLSPGFFDTGNKIKSYAGDWKDGKKCGFGTAIYFCGDVYCGAWEKDIPHGKGSLKRVNGLEYCGDFKRGLYEGQGVKKFPGPDGYQYSGNFLCGTYDGQGTLTKSNGEVSSGEWMSGVLGGLGLRTLADGSYYSGHFFNNLYHGQGTLFSVINRSIFVGTFIDGEQKWEGIITHHNRDVCIRSYYPVSNKKLVEFKFANGDVFTGTKIDDADTPFNISYHGVMRYADGFVIRGDFSSKWSLVSVTTSYFSTFDSVKKYLLTKLGVVF